MSATTPPTGPYGLIQLASRQVMPNILMALPLLRCGSLRRHVVFHTDDASESERPAKHLVDTLCNLGEAEATQWFIEPVEPSADHVYAAAQAVIEEGEPDLRWVLHVSGGTKTMAWGLMQLSRHPRVAAVLYRDLGAAAWRRLGIAADGGPQDEWLAPAAGHKPVDTELAALAEQMARPEGRLSSLSLGDLLKCQLAPGDAIPDPEAKQERQRLNFSGVEGRADVDVVGWLRAAMKDHRGFGLSAPVKARLPRHHSDGSAFECWLACALLALGARQAQWNVVLGKQNGTLLVEFDVAACHDDRLLVMDVKLVPHDSTGKSAELRVAQHTAQWMAGRSVHTIVLRPNWYASDVVQTVSEQIGTQLFTREDLQTLPQRLQQLLGIEPTEQQRRIAQQLSALLAQAVAAAARGTGRNTYVFRHNAT